jgi:flagellar basal-body rod protein FlgB
MILDKIARTFFEAAQALNLRAKRSEVLASNIANADTPHYKAQDFDFRTALTNAMQKSDLLLTQTHEAHLDPRPAAPGSFRLQYRIPAQASIDGNTVEVDAEVGRYSDNALRYRATMTFLNEEISHVRTAIKGG